MECSSFRKVSFPYLPISIIACKISNRRTIYNLLFFYHPAYEVGKNEEKLKHAITASNLSMQSLPP